MADYRAGWEVGATRHEARDRGWGSPLPAGYGSARRYPPAVDRGSGRSNRPDGRAARVGESSGGGAGPDSVAERLAKLKVGLLRPLLGDRPARRRAALWTGSNLRGRSASPPPAAPSVLDGSRAGVAPHVKPTARVPDASGLAGYPVAAHGESTRQVTYIDIYSVAKVSMVFYVILLVVFVVASILLWLVADAFGAVDSIQRSIRSLFDVKSFVLHPVTIALYTSAFGAVLAVAGTIANVLGAVIYNLISDVVGGVRIGVVPEDTSTAASPGTGAAPAPGAASAAGPGWSQAAGTLREAESHSWRRRAR